MFPGFHGVEFELVFFETQGAQVDLALWGSHCEQEADDFGIYVEGIDGGFLIVRVEGHREH